MSNNKKSFEERAAAAPTELHKRFAEWIEIETGFKPDMKSVQLACALRMDFQRSDENQSSLADRKAAAAAKAVARKAEKKAKLEAQLAKLQAELAEGDAPVAEPAPRPAAKKTTPSKPATAPVAAPVAATGTPAPVKPRTARTRRTAPAKRTAPKAFDSVPETDK
ncbi:hypothetical protein [Streptomyces sp. NBC_00459]|uniref:hypothetical protein n=1 Tax=Streptomyces sp. NBC_00459 TaxID=2975749 RepID=UPI002E19D440